MGNALKQPMLPVKLSASWQALEQAPLSSHYLEPGTGVVHSPAQLCKEQDALTYF